MADPLSILGAGLGAASLVLQITDECIKRYKFFTEASHMPENYRYLRVRLQIEQQRFISFAIAAGLLAEDHENKSIIDTDEELLTEILLQIHKLFLQFETINGRYVDWNMQDDHDEMVEEAGPQTSLAKLVCRTRSDDSGARPLGQSAYSRTAKALNITDRALNKFKRLRIVLAEPKRLIWVNSDKETFEGLIQRLGELNSFLSTLLDQSRIAKHEKAVESSYLEILQLRNEVSQLQELRKALEGANGLEWTHTTQSTTISDKDRRAYLKELTSIKISRVSISKVNLPKGCLSHLDLTPLLENCDSFHWYTSGSCRTLRKWNGKSVWCESIIIPPTRPNFHKEESGQTENRLAMLATLLGKQLPARFRTPRCLGFVRAVDDHTELKLGLIFEQPPNTTVENRPIDLRRLFDLRPKPKPPLLARLRICIALAESIFQFHAVNWLHKGIRSENVLFFSSDVEHPDSKCWHIPQPYLAGFDLSRPGDAIEMTAQSMFDPKSDIYRHPLALATDGCGAYRKSYDLYSLGILFLEVGCWKRIDKLLKVSLETMKPPELYEVHESLLNGCITKISREERASFHGQCGISSCLQNAADKCGNAFRDVIEACLIADQIEKPVYRGETRTATAQRLRTVFEEQILGRLRSVIKVLEGIDHDLLLD